MGYTIANDSVCDRKRTAASSAVTPKTHTPGSPLQKPGLRFYNPGIGRWISRDPAEEEASVSLYLALNNNLVGRIDYLGLIEFSDHLTQDEAWRLKCSLNTLFAAANWVRMRAAHGHASAASRYVERHRYELEALSWYVNGDGSPLTLDSNLLGASPPVQRAHLKAKRYFWDNPFATSHTEFDISLRENRDVLFYLLGTFHIDYFFDAIHNTTLAPSHIYGIAKDRYDFHDDPDKTIEMPFLDDVASICCWHSQKGNWVSSRWLHDLAIYGFAKGFDIVSPPMDVGVPEEIPYWRFYTQD